MENSVKSNTKKESNLGVEEFCNIDFFAKNEKKLAEKKLSHESAMSDVSAHLMDIMEGVVAA